MIINSQKQPQSTDWPSNLLTIVMVRLISKYCDMPIALYYYYYFFNVV